MPVQRARLSGASAAARSVIPAPAIPSGAESRKADLDGWVDRVVTLGLLTYLTVYSLESPIRYLLYLVHADPLILARDLCIDIPVCLLLASQLLHHKVHMAFKLFAVSALIAGVIFFLNFGVILPIVIGAKIIINIVLGLVAGGKLLNPTKRVRNYLAAVLIVALGGVMAEKFLFTFPWVGLHATIANTDIEISKDWQVEDAFSRRVGGFMHESINAAGLLPVLALIIASQFRSMLLRFALLVLTAFCIFLTTQKGSIAGFALVTVLMLFPMALRLFGFRVLLVIGAILQAALPFVTQGMVMAQGGGNVFSGSSFAMRVMVTWPASLRWILDHFIFPFGVGLGGMGVPLRSVAPGVWEFPDNMFLFVFAYYGVFSIAIYGAMMYASWRSVRVRTDIVEPALAVGVFLIFYGMVISVIEDQIMALALGSAFGVIFNAELVPRTMVTLQDYKARRAAAKAAGRLGPARGPIVPAS